MTIFRSIARHQAKRSVQGTLLALTLVAALPVDASAETPPGTVQAPPAVSGGAPALPDSFKLNMLIRTTLIALNQANLTGNYSVLRDLGTPQFQAMNTDTRLGEIFAGLRSRKLDLSPVLFFDPKLVREPALQPTGLLRLTGFIPTEPQRILFDMGFERVGEQWRLSAIVIDVQQAPVSAPSAKNEKPKGATKNKAVPTKSAAPEPAP